MQMTTKLIESKVEWETGLSQFPQANFLQSWQWGQFYEALEKKAFYVGTFRDNKLAGVGVATYEPARRGSYLAVAGGPLLDFGDEEVARAFLGKVQELARQLGCWFVRIRPQQSDTPLLRGQLEELELVAAPMHLTLELTVRLDLSKTNEQLILEMRKTTRYELRQVEKQGIRVQVSRDSKDIDRFYTEQLRVAQQHHFVPFSKKWLRLQFEALLEDDHVALYQSFQGDELLASCFVIFYGNEADYHYGVSTPMNRKLSGTHAALWAAMQDTRERGIRWFDLWGIAPEDRPKHRFAGVSKFKKGWGGEIWDLCPAHDLPVSPLYWLTYGFETVRRKLRGL